MTLLGSELLLQQQGLHLDTATSGGDAMTLLSKRDYDLCLFDVNLPDLSGYALCSWYKEMCRTEGRACGEVVAVTADPDLEACKEFGIDICLPKPLSNARIVELLHELWSRRGAAAGWGSRGGAPGASQGARPGAAPQGVLMPPDGVTKPPPPTSVAGAGRVARPGEPTAAPPPPPPAAPLPPHLSSLWDAQQSRPSASSTPRRRAASAQSLPMDIN